MSEWKNKLESLERLSAQPLDKSKAWDKLYNRLQEKPRRKNVLVYWIAAAACLLFGFMLIRFINNREIDLKPGDHLTKKQEQPNNDVQADRQLINPAIQEIPQSTEIRKPVIAIKKENKPLKIIKVPIELPIIRQEDTVSKNIQLAVNQPEQLPSMNLPPQTKKKQIRVVHINELGKQREEVNMAQREPSGNIYFKIGSSDYQVNKTPGMASPGANHSRIVFNPTN